MIRYRFTKREEPIQYVPGSISVHSWELKGIIDNAFPCILSITTKGNWNVGTYCHSKSFPEECIEECFEYLNYAREELNYIDWTPINEFLEKVEPNQKLKDFLMKSSCSLDKTLAKEALDLFEELFPEG